MGKTIIKQVVTKRGITVELHREAASRVSRFTWNTLNIVFFVTQPTMAG
jgi:hypothetical protein